MELQGKLIEGQDVMVENLENLNSQEFRVIIPSFGHAIIIADRNTYLDRKVTQNNPNINLVFLHRDGYELGFKKLHGFGKLVSVGNIYSHVRRGFLSFRDSTYHYVKSILEKDR